MGLKISAIDLDELPVDPSPLIDGKVWYNSTEKRVKMCMNGIIYIIEHTVHTHIANDIDTDESGKTVQDKIDDLDAVDHTHPNKTELDLITDGDHDIRTDNPHAVIADQIDTSESGKNVQEKLDELASAPAGGTLASVQLRRTTLYNMTASWTDLPFDATDIETDATVLEHDDTNTERINIKATGTYLFSFRFDVAGMADARIYKNGTIQLAGSLCQNADEIIGTVCASCTAGDYVTVQIQSSPPKDITINSDIIFNAILLNGVVGADGAQGIQGIQGDQGIQGVAGNDGAQGIQGDKGLIWQGTWISQNYVVDDSVEYLGSAYICILNTVSSEVPTNTTYWDLLAQKGDAGATGSQGIQGIQGIQGVAGNDGADGVKIIELTFHDVTNSTSYIIASEFIFRGTTALGTPTKIKVICDSVSGGDVKIYDVTNAQTICEKTGISSASPSIFDLGTLSNLPAGEAIFEVQHKKVSSTMTTHGLSVQF